MIGGGLMAILSVIDKNKKQEAVKKDEDDRK